jgi:hypothetical protein
MKCYNRIFSVGIVGLILALPALAAPSNTDKPAALEGIQAQALSADEMQAVSGELNAFDIAAALFSAAEKLDKFPKLQAATLQLANYYLNNAESINAVFMKLGIFTPCQSCPP